MKNKITIVGGGSTYTPGMVGELMARKSVLNFDEICLYDIFPEKAMKMAKFLGMYFESKGEKVKIYHEEKMEDAFNDRDFILIQIREGGPKQRMINEKLSIDHGMVGQETCGPAGFAFALGQISPLVDMIKLINKVAPKAWVINYSNPVAIMIESVTKEVDCSRVMWICDQPPSDKRALSATIGKKPEDIEWDYYGLNHFGWYTKAEDKATGENLIPQIRQAIITDTYKADIHEKDEKGREKILLFHRFKWYLEKFSDTLPSNYLQYYFFAEKQVAKVKKLGHTRGEEVYNGRFHKLYKDINEAIKNNKVASDLVVGVHGRFIVDHIEAIVTKKPKNVMVNIMNNGYIKNIPSEWYIEAPGVVSQEGLKFEKSGGMEIPEWNKALLEQQKAYELTTYYAWKEKSYDLALKALSINKLVPSADKAKTILDEFIKVNPTWPKLK